ncbi:MAG: hypothetical protein Q4G05_00100 [Clostridia bacterium]|nr:hypothetical protein [Clostridia bacterium]
MKNKNVKVDYQNWKRAVAYAVIALHTFKNTANAENLQVKDFKEEELAQEMIAIMELHTPDEAIKRADKILKEE